MKTLGAVAVLVGILVYLSFGTLSPCGILRESIRKYDAIAAVLPDGLIDVALAAQFGALSPGRCISILLNGEGTPIATVTPTQQPRIPQQVLSAPPAGEEALKAAFKESETAMKECRAKRLNGQLKTHVESVKCSNPRIMQAFSAANYRYMDLVALLTTKRLEGAEKIDRNELTEIQAHLEYQKLYSDIVAVERRRDDAGR